MNKKNFKLSRIFFFVLMFLSILALSVVGFYAKTAHNLLRFEVEKHNLTHVRSIHPYLSRRLNSWMDITLGFFQEALKSSQNDEILLSRFQEDPSVSHSFIAIPARKIVRIFRFGKWLDLPFEFNSPTETANLIPEAEFLRFTKMVSTILEMNPEKNEPVAKNQIQSYSEPHFYGIEKNGIWTPFCISSLQISPSTLAYAGAVFNPEYIRKLAIVSTERYPGVIIKITGLGPTTYLSDSGVQLHRYPWYILKDLASIGPFDLGKLFGPTKIRVYYPSEWDTRGTPTFDSTYAQYFFARVKNMTTLVFLPLTLLILGLLLLYAKLKESDQRIRIQNDWIENLAHDLKTPVHAIGTVTELLQEDEKDESRLKLFAMIHTELQRITRTARTFMHLSAFGKKNFHVHTQHFSLSCLIEKAVQSCLLIHHQKAPQITMTLCEQDEIIANEEAIYDVILNIMDNSCKYSNSPPKIEISTNQNEKSLILKIKDRGFGIEKEETEKIFSPFYRISNQKTEGIQGNGLGLSIVKKVMLAHKGEVKIFSVPDQGTEITLKFPR